MHSDVPIKHGNNREIYPPEHGRHSEPGPYPSGEEVAQGRQRRPPQHQSPPSHDLHGFGGEGQYRPSQRQPSSHVNCGFGGEGYRRQARSQPHLHSYDLFGAQSQEKHARSKPSERELPYQHQQPFRAGSQGDMDLKQEYYAENRGRGVNSVDVPMKHNNNRGMYPPEHGGVREPIRGSVVYSSGEVAQGRQGRSPRAHAQHQPSTQPPSHADFGFGGEGYSRQAISQPQLHSYDLFGDQPQGLPYQHQQPLRACSQGDMDPQHPMSAAGCLPRQPPPPGVSLATQTSIQGSTSIRGSGGKEYGSFSTENDKIAREIEEMAAVVQDEVSQDNKYKETQDLTPFDSNLVCPMCGKEHRIGEIQKFKIHVDKCEGKGTLI